MRSILSKTIVLAALSVFFLCTNGNPVVRDISCAGENCNAPRPIEGVFVKGLHTPHPPILPRAAGGGRPSKPNDRGPEGVPTHPNDPNNPNGPGSQTGENGGFDSPETVGGFSDLCQKRSMWSVFWKRAGCGSGSATSPSAAHDGPPLVRNNYLQSATEGEPIRTDRPINIAERRSKFEAGIQELKDSKKGTWFFYSGFEFSEVNTWKGEVQIKLGHEVGYLRDLVKTEGPPYMEEFQRFTAGNSQWYFWAANSKAFAQAVQGKVYAVVPDGTAINQPYSDHGSNWWSYELPELTRNEKVESVSVFFADPMDAGDALGEAKVIWQRGDTPLGSPGDETREYARPNEAWMG